MNSKPSAWCYTADTCTWAINYLLVSDPVREDKKTCHSAPFKTYSIEALNDSGRSTSKTYVKRSELEE